MPLTTASDPTIIGEGFTLPMTTTASPTNAESSPETPPDVAVRNVRPCAMAVTSPACETATVSGAFEDHDTGCEGIGLSFASTTVATTVTVSSTFRSVTGSGVKRRPSAIWATATAISLPALPAEAVITALPFPVAVTRPVVETDATDPLEVAHETGTSVMVSPDWSRTIAVTRTVSLRAPNDTLATERTTVLGTGCWFAVGLSEQAANTTTASRTTGARRLEKDRIYQNACGEACVPPLRRGRPLRRFRRSPRPTGHRDFHCPCGLSTPY